MLAANARDVRFRAVNVQDLISGRDTAEYDAIIVQRDIVDAADVDAFVTLCRERGIPIIAELDDDLLSDHARERLTANGYDPRALDALQTVVSEADLVTVSTDVMAERVAPYAARVEVVANELDARLWGDSVPERSTDDEPTDPAAPVRVVYIGSRTHGHDLELLRPVFDGLRTADGREVRLSVVGVSDDDAEWFDRVPIPASATAYPRFVPWLRSMAADWKLGVAPLADTEFNEAKSDLKFLEYTLLGLPVVASDLPPYGGLTEHGLTVVPNDPQAWRSAILAALDDRPAASESADRAQRYAREHRTIHRGDAGRRWVELVRELATAKQSKERNG
jgi:glycosyltransferase involved in cell wall biosynthesis